MRQVFFVMLVWIFFIGTGCTSSTNRPETGAPSSDPPRRFEATNDAIPIDVKLIASEKKLPQNFDDAAFQRSTVPHYEYLIMKAENETEFERLWKYFALTPNDIPVNFAEKQVFFVGVRESGSCPYHLGDVQMNPEGTELTLHLVGTGEICTADATPRTFVIEANKEDVREIQEVMVMEGGTPTIVPIG